jgi:hypothetical protein
MEMVASGCLRPTASLLSIEFAQQAPLEKGWHSLTFELIHSAWPST